MDKEHKKITGEDYRKLIITAAQMLENNKEEINELNVFPVPDGDTGSNMSMTVSNAAQELLGQSGVSLDQIADTTAKAMLHGARGNSGVIISLLFKGIASALAESDEADGIAWARALRHGVDAAYNAVDRPAEGTILTVARCCADAAEKAAKENNSFEYVLKSIVKEAEIALANTIKQNPVLEKAGVVDAGGKGFLLVMQAMLASLSEDGINLEIKPVEHKLIKEKADFSAFDTDSIKFGFCTEFIIDKHEKNSDASELKEYLNGIGDSLVFVDDGDIIKVHVHTNVPHEVLGKALEYGVYETVKVENMKIQHTNKMVEETAQKIENKKYGFISVANGDGIKEIFKDLGVDEIVSGGQTMNPSTQDISDAVEKIHADTIFILPNNKNIIMTANQVSEIIKDKKIVVIPTKSIPQGFSAMLGFDEEEDAEYNESSMNECFENTDTMQVTYAARNSNYDGMTINEGDYLALLNDKLLSNGKDLDAIIENLCDTIIEKDKSVVNIYYGSDVSEDEANHVLDIVNSKLSDAGIEATLFEGKQPVYYYIISAE